jgi:hypothetical protein
MIAATRQTTLRHGVIMPDWSAVAAPQAREALAAIVDIVGIGAKLSGMGAGEDRLWRQVLRRFAETGRGASYRELTAATGLPEEDVIRDLASLRARDLVVLDEAGAHVIGAYPFSEQATPHRVQVDGARVYAMCAIDALGVGAMLRRDVVIDSRCHLCGEPIAVATRDDGEAIAHAAPAKATVWSGIAYADNCAANSLCRVLVFFCSAAHLAEWREGLGGASPGFRLTLCEALEVGKALFRPLLREPV